MARPVSLTLPLRDPAKKMEYKVFYSWQSDLPNPTNRGFIQVALEKAAAIVAKDESVAVSPLVDRDTQGVPGSPEIGATIFTKIDGSQAFVCDISIINSGADGRPVPNPNVMLELGYAARALGWDRIVMVMNTAYGRIEDLPFDLRTRRVVTYEAREGEPDRSAERSKLTAVFDAALRAMAHNVAPAAAAGGTVIRPKGLDLIAIESVEEARPNQALHVRRFMSSLVERLFGAAPDMSDEEGRDERLVNAIDATLPMAVEFARVAGAVSAMGAEQAAHEIFKGFERLLERYDRPRDHSGGYNTGDFDFYKFIGHELFVMFIAALLREGKLEIIATVLEETFRPNNIGVVRGDPPSTFVALSKHLGHLADRNKRLGLHRTSLHADILKARHTEGELASESPLEEFTAADVFLFLRGEVTGEIDSPWIRWIPWSVLYLQRVPRFLEDAERSSYATRVRHALGTASLDHLRTVYVGRAPKLGELYRMSFWENPLLAFDPKRIESR